MNQRLLLALLTALGFAAGFSARVWTESAQPLPEPPKLGTEFGPKSAAPVAKNPADRSKLLTDIAGNKAQIDSYQSRVQALQADFERGFSALLRPDQCTLYAEALKKHAAKVAEHDAKALGTLTDDQIDSLMQRPLIGILYDLEISATVDHLAKDYKLDADQQGRTRTLLLARREGLMALIDSTPSPSVRLSALAPVMAKLYVPAKK
jgi:hypothetical protein